MKKSLLPIFFLTWVATMWAQPLSVDYIRSVQGLNKAELKSALHALIQPRSVLQYGGKDEDYTWAGFAQTDVMPDGVSVRDRYSNNQRVFDGYAAVNGMNIEHIWANSWWGHTRNNAYCDLFNLYPSDAEANQRKSNNPIGVVDDDISFENGVILVGKSRSYRTDSLIMAWEPADEWKGDFARTYFYMATTYQHMTNEWQTTEGLLTIDPASWTTMRSWVYELMLKWAGEDPVDDIERTRNEVIYSIQGNRNPYVDVPELSDYVWGAQNENLFYIDPTSTTPEIFVPIHDTPLDFGLQALSLGMTRQVVVRGYNFPTGLTATIEGDGFAMAETRLTSDEVKMGKALTITSNATAGGAYEARLILRSEDYFEQSTPLQMTIIDGVPTYAARDIVCSVYNRSFTASWMNMQLADGETYTLDVYTKTASGERTSFGDYPIELTDTCCIVKNPNASTTYYYEVSTSGGLVGNEVEVEMPAVTPIFEVSPLELYFTAVPDEPSASQSVKLNVMGITGYAVDVTCPEPFELSLDGESWTHELSLTSAELPIYVRFSGAADQGVYEEELTLSLADVKDIIIPLVASVDATKAFFESFELGNKGSYAEAAVTCNAATWLMSNAMLAKDVNSNDARSVRMKMGGSITMQDDKLGGCDSLWFYAGLYNKDTKPKLTVSYSLDAGSTWTPVVSDLAFTNGEWKRYGYAIRQEGNIRLKFEIVAKQVQNQRINLDDIQMSNYKSTDALETLPASLEMSPQRVFTLDGRYVGSVLPSSPGIYLIRQGSRVMKRLVP